MNDTNPLIPRPPFSLDPAGQALITEWFPGFRLLAFPGLAHAHEEVVLKLLLQRDLDDYECRFSCGYTAWEAWQPARATFTRTFVTPGETAMVFCQLRYRGVESPITVTPVEALPQFSIRPGPGEPSTLTILEQGAAFAVACTGGVLYWNRRTNEQYYVRAGRAGTETTLVSPEGKIMTQHRTLGKDDQGQYIFHPEVSVHDLYSGELLSRFQLEEKEEMRQALTPAGDLITRWTKQPIDMGKMFRGEPTPIYNTPYFTRLWNLSDGLPCAEYPGILMAASPNGIGAVAFHFNETLSFREHYRHEQVRSTYYLTTLRGGPAHKIRFSPSGAFAAVTAVTPNRQGAFTFDHTTYEIVRTSSGGRLAPLPEKMSVHELVSDELLWVTDEGEADLSRKLKLYDWAEGRVVATLPVYALAQAARLPLYAREMVLHFASDSLMPDVVAALCGYVQEGKKAIYLTREDDYSELHTLPYTWPNKVTPTMAATSRRIYSYMSDSTVQRYDLESGEYVGEMERHTLEPPGDSYRAPELVSGGELVILAKSGFSDPKDQAYWGVDDRTDETFYWHAPTGMVKASSMDSDGDATLLWSIALGDPQREKERKEEALKALNNVFGALMNETTTASQASAPQAGKQEEPPQLHGLCIWNHRTGETHLVALPQPCKQTCYLPEQERWLVLTLHNEDEFNEGGSNLTKRTLHLNVYTISLQGEKKALLSYPFELFIDERVKLKTSTPDGRSYTHGKIYEPAIALSRPRPGQLAFYTLTSLGVIDVFRQDIGWQCPNPMAYKYDIPQKIVPLPGERIWASFNAGSVIIDSRGQIDPAGVRSYGWEPSVYENAIVYPGRGLWQVIKPSNARSSRNTFQISSSDRL
jgi:hypothetical protein